MEPVARHLTEIHSADSWAYRELALIVGRLGRLEEALGYADHAQALEPNNAYTYCTRGHIYLFMGRRAEAKDDFRRAIRLSVDNPFGIESLVDAGANLVERKEALQFI